MNTKILATAVGGHALFCLNPAHASLIAWEEPVSRQLEVSWSTDAAAALAAYLPGGKHAITDDKALGANQRGPLGGVLLNQVGRASFEVDPKTGRIFGVLTDRRGKIVDKRALVDLFSSVPEAFKSGSDIHVLVTTRRTRGTLSSALLEGDRPVQRQLQVDIAVYAPSGDGVKVIDEATLAFDTRSLRPVVSASALQAWAGTGITQYWTVSTASGE